MDPHDAIWVNARHFVAEVFGWAPCARGRLPGVAPGAKGPPCHVHALRWKGCHWLLKPIHLFVPGAGHLSQLCSSSHAAYCFCVLLFEGKFLSRDCKCDT